jgi:predicted HTH transcriptional regulator
MILSKWKPFFAWVPIESLIHDSQQEYYDALGKANNCDNINPFVEYMLQLLKEALLEIKATNQGVGDYVGDYVGDNEKQLLKLLRDNPKLSAAKAAEQIGLSSRQVERIIKKLKDRGKLVRHGSDHGGYWEVVE